MKIILRVILGISAFIVVIMVLTTFVAEPWARNKIETAFNENSVDYRLKIGRVHISILRSAIELEDITLFSIRQHNSIPDFKGEIKSVHLLGINLSKALFKSDIIVNQVDISNSRIIGKIPLHKKGIAPKISSINIRIDSLFVDKLGIELKDSSTAMAYSIKDGVLKIFDFQIEKQDTFSTAILKKFDFDAQELQMVLSDSMYTFTGTGINYSTISKILSASNFSIHPNYNTSDFASLHEFQSDRIEADLNAMHISNFSIPEYFNSGALKSSYVEIGEMEINVFRDKNKPFRHVKKPTFQEMIYNFPGTINIDSLGILAGNIAYTEHAEKAKEPGTLKFNDLIAKLHKVTNDTLYKTEKAFLELKSEALLMGKGKIVVALKAELFNVQNTFTVDGSLSKMEISDLNPFLENNAFIYATAGTIDNMTFSFEANNTKSSGKMSMLYHDLDIAVKNKQTNDTTGVKAWFITLIANKAIMNSNPIPGEQVRIGIIDKERDPERFLFNYCAKSIISGIKTSLSKNNK